MGVARHVLDSDPPIADNFSQRPALPGDAPVIRQSLALACALIVPAALSAQDKYTIKLSHGKKGDISLHAKESTQVEAVTITGADGNVIEDKKKTTIDVNKYREEILEQSAGKRPTKVKRTYTEATRKVDGDYQKLAYHEKTVMIELKGDKYVFTVDGKELSTEESTELAKNFDPKKPSDDEMDKMLLPGKAVGEGDSWELSAKELAKLFGEEDKLVKAMDIPKAKASGKLIKAYKKDGHQFGQVEFKIAIPLKALEGMHPCRDGATIELSIAGEMCIDGSIAANSGTVSSKIAGVADIVQDDQKTGVTVKFDINGKEKSTSEPVKK